MMDIPQMETKDGVAQMVDGNFIAIKPVRQFVVCLIQSPKNSN